MLRYTSFLSHPRAQSRTIIGRLFSPIRLGPAYRKVPEDVYCGAHSPRHKCQRRSGNALPIYATSRVAFIKNVFVSPATSWVWRTGLFIRPLAAVQSQSDGVQLCLVLGYRHVLEGAFSPSPPKKGPSFYLSFLLSFHQGL